MKKATVMAFLFVVLAFHAKAQTAEESIKWICDKINRYGNYSVSYCAPDAQGNKYYYKQESMAVKGNWVSKIFTVKKVDPDGGRDYFGLAMIYNGQLKIEYTKVTAFTGCDGAPYLILTLKSGRVFAFYFPWDREPDLANRMQKALNHLIDLSKSNEAF